jgi:hypothetical protein
LCEQTFAKNIATDRMRLRPASGHFQTLMRAAARSALPEKRQCGRTRAEIERLLFAIVGYGRFPAEFRALGMSTTRVSNSFFKGALIIG